MNKFRSCSVLDMIEHYFFCLTLELFRTNMNKPIIDLLCIVSQ